jgi:hypothetical protein
MMPPVCNVAERQAVSYYNPLNDCLNDFGRLEKTYPLSAKQVATQTLIPYLFFSRLFS